MPALPPGPPTIGPNRGRCCCCRCCRGFARNKSAGAQEAAERATKCPLCRAPVLLWGPAASAAKGHRMSFRRIERRQGSGAARGSTLECAPRRPPPRNGPDWRREIAGCQSVAQLGVAAKTKTAGKAFRVELGGFSTGFVCFLGQKTRKWAWYCFDGTLAPNQTVSRAVHFWFLFFFLQHRCWCD